MALTHIVGVSDCKLSADRTDSVITCALGSCLGVSLFDTVTHTVGILHIMLPTSQYRSLDQDLNPFMYANTGLPIFLQEILSRGARRGCIEAKLAGGACMLQGFQSLNIGSRNIEAVTSVLARENIPIRGSSLGGSVSRTMTLLLDDGRVTVRLLGQGLKEL